MKNRKQKSEAAALNAENAERTQRAQRVRAEVTGYTPGELLHGPEHKPDDEPMHVDLLQINEQGFAERQMAKVYFGQDIGQIRANAARLATAWNCHDDLLAACQMIVERWERGDLAEAARACESAIARAKGGEK